MKSIARLRKFFIILLAALGSCAADAQSATSKIGLVLAHITVVDVRTGALHSDQTVIVEGNLIQSIGPSASAKPQQNVRTVDCTGLFLIPGLWDMHVHLMFGDWFPGAKEISLPLFI